MVNFCSAFNCTSSSDVRKDLSFHKFPLKEKERLQKWVHAVRRKDFKPSSSSTLCSLHFIESDFLSAVVSGKLMLKKCAVPTVFNLPNHLMPKIKERRILQREMDNKKSRGGSSCAVATCTNYSGKLKNSGLINVSFHRFPKDSELCKKWEFKCRRSGLWNPKTSYICSSHFHEDDFIRDSKAELLGYIPKVRRLNPAAIPTLNLPEDHASSLMSQSMINRMDVKLDKQKMPPEKQKRLHKCDKCIRSYTNVVALEEHKKAMHSARTEMAVKPQERFMCTVCKANFPSRFVVMKHMEVYHAKWVSKGIHPVPLQECSVCKAKNVDLTVHECSADERYLSISTDSFKTQTNPLFCASTSCSDAFNSPTKFDFHVQVRHNKNMEVMFFPDMTEFCRWKADLEKSISIQFTENSEEMNGRKFYSCVNTKVTKLFIERCPATIVVQKFTKGVLVKYYTEHNRHNVNEYNITKKDQKYRITDYLPPNDDESGYDPYLDFKTLLENIVLGAAKININGLKELVGRALEMTVILNTYDQEKESTKFTQIIEHMTDDEITKVLLKDPGVVTLKRVSLNPHVSEPPNKKMHPDIAPKIVNTFSLAENPLANTSDTDSMHENDIDDKILISNMLEKKKRPINDSVNVKLDELKDKEFVSFNESYRDFVRKNQVLPPSNLRTSRQSKNNTKSYTPPATKNKDMSPVNNKSTANSNQNRVSSINTVNTIASTKKSANVSMPVSNAGETPPTHNLLTNNIVLVALPPSISNSLVNTNIGGVNVPAVDMTNYSITTSAATEDIKNSNATTNNGSIQNPSTNSPLPTLGGVKKPNISAKKKMNKKTKRSVLNRKAKVKTEDGTSPVKSEIADDAEKKTVKEDINISRHESDTDAKIETDTEKSCTDHKNIIKQKSDVEQDSDTESGLQEFLKNKRKSREKEAPVKVSSKKIDIEYKVIEQDSDCNILVLKL